MAIEFWKNDGNCFSEKYENYCQSLVFSGKLQISGGSVLLVMVKVSCYMNK